MTSLLVTGASGFVGTNLIRHLYRLGHDVHEVSRQTGDIAQRETWSRFPPCEFVIHLAANTFVPASWDQPTEFLSTNLLGTSQALEYCHQHGAKLVLLSSYLYGNPAKLPISEDHPLSPTNPYALSKDFAEQLCAFYKVANEVDSIILRPFNIYGPGQSSNFLIPSILRQITTEDRISVMSLTPRRDYVYVDDVVSAIVAALAYEGKHRCFNIGYGQSYSVNELISIMQTIWGTNLPILSSDIKRPHEILDTVADISLAENELGWSPQFAMSDGLTAIRNQM